MTKKTASPKAPSKKPASKPASKSKESPSIKAVRKGSCPSLSGKSTLTYEVGQDAKKSFYFKVVANTGGGYWSGAEWFAWKDIQGALKGLTPITSMPLRSLSKMRSVNTSGFITAVLLNEELLESLPEKTRHFKLTGISPVAKKALSSKAPTKATKRKASSAKTKK